jgi:NADP-dependent 3-hydroxy acid dehydrogenase YdfG
MAYCYFTLSKAKIEKKIWRRVLKMPKHVFITAGSKGIGRKVTETLVKKGYFVTVNYRQE